ncbi:MAG: hypothetical protein ACXWH1_11560 [Thermoanaerobaculia bacterium]
MAARQSAPQADERETYSVAGLGGIADVRKINAGHEVMLTHPDELARQLLELIRCL